MIENKTRGKQLLEEVKEKAPFPGIKNPLKSKFTKMLVDIRGLFTKPQIKGGLKQVPGTKKEAVPFSAVFSAQKLDLRSVNQFFAVILIGLVMATAYVVFRRPPSISEVTAAVAKIHFQDIETGPVTPFEKLAFYLDQIKKRDIFNEYVEYVPPPPAVEVKAEPPPPPPKITIQEKAKNLTLMGISWGDESKAIIKDGQTQEVHFLKEGQKITGTEIKVKTILRKGVIISSDDEEMTML